MLVGHAVPQIMEPDLLLEVNQRLVVKVRMVRVVVARRFPVLAVFAQANKGISHVIRNYFRNIVGLS